MKLGKWLALTALVLATGCGKSNVEALCEKAEECNDLDPGESLEECVSEENAFYDSRTPAGQAAIDTAIETCIDKSCGEYKECIESGGVE